MAANSQNNIESLREALFATLRDLRAQKIDPESAQAVCKLSSEIISTARVELDYIRTIGGGARGTGFLEAQQPEKPRLEAAA